jgi:fibro-slime domain-containing protein
MLARNLIDPRFLRCFVVTMAVGGAGLACGSDPGPGSTYSGTSANGTKSGNTPDAGEGVPPGASLGESQVDGSTGSRSDAGCSPNLTGTVRDFKRGDQAGGHPDFETFTGAGMKGIVADLLGADGKPVYAPAGPTPFTSGKANFDQWYRDVPGVNIPLPYRINPVEKAPGKYTFETTAFFPIDGLGFGNQDFTHNFSFTFELHTEFVYDGGEVFTFRGDDDLWTFINGHLAIDLGGLHEPQEATIALDSAAAKLGLEKGKTYPLDVFHAERHTEGSNFRIDTTIRFTNCTPIIK